MLTLTPSGISSNSSEWLLRNCQPKSIHRVFRDVCRCGRSTLRQFPRGQNGNRGMRRIGMRERMVNVHVLHLEGCCGLAGCRVGISKLATLNRFRQARQLVRASPFRARYFSRRITTTSADRPSHHQLRCHSLRAGTRLNKLVMRQGSGIAQTTAIL